MVPGVLGTLQATECLKVLTGIGEPLVGRLLAFDALEARFQQFKVKRRADCPVCGDAPTLTELIDYDAFCGTTVPEVPSLTPDEVRARDGVVLLDVREPGEREVFALEGALTIPYGELEARFQELPTDVDLVVCCRVGERSARAVALLRRVGLHRAFNLAGGLERWNA